MTRYSYDRMSAHDVGYLNRETASQPLHFVVELDLAGHVDVTQLQDLVRARVAALPFLTRMPRRPLLAGRPVWVDDPDFAVERHVEPWPSDGAPVDVAAVLHDLTMSRLPRDRPLWRIVVVSRPDGNASLLICCHHAMLDGSLLATMLTGLFRESASLPPVRPRRAPGRTWLLAAVVARRAWGAVRRAEAATAPAATAPQPGRQQLETTLTGEVSPRRALAAASVELAAVQQRRRELGATVNDLFLAAVTDALRDYLDPLPDQVVALVPRDVRAADEALQVGNRGWSMLVPLPVSTPDADERLRQITAATAAGKAADTTSGTQGWRFDIALTNVRLGGPLEVLGVPATGHRVTVPLQGTNRIVVVATSLGSELALSVTADDEAFPDASRLARLSADALVGLRTGRTVA